jgi:hypothetical protein
MWLVLRAWGRSRPRNQPLRHSSLAAPELRCELRPSSASGRSGHRKALLAGIDVCPELPVHSATLLRGLLAAGAPAVAFDTRSFFHTDTHARTAAVPAKCAAAANCRHSCTPALGKSPRATHHSAPPAHGSRPAERAAPRWAAAQAAACCGGCPSAPPWQPWQRLAASRPRCRPIHVVATDCCRRRLAGRSVPRMLSVAPASTHK